MGRSLSCKSFMFYRYTVDSGNSEQFCLLMRGVHYSVCSLCYKKIAHLHQKCSLMRDCSLFRRLLLPEYTVHALK